MQRYIDQLYIPLYYGFILVIQPFLGWFSDHWLVRKWVIRNRPWLVDG